MPLVPKKPSLDEFLSRLQSVEFSSSNTKILVICLFQQLFEKYDVVEISPSTLDYKYKFLHISVGIKSHYNNHRNVSVNINYQEPLKGDVILVDIIHVKNVSPGGKKIESLHKFEYNNNVTEKILMAHLASGGVL